MELSHKRPISEFNTVASPPPELARRLLYLTESGSPVVLAAQMGPAATERRVEAERKRHHDQRFVQAMLATEEQQRKFDETLTRLEQASYAALLENEEKLEEARDRLQAIRDEAREVVFPDGTLRKVYRDGQTVRDDDGAEVGPDLALPEDVSDRLEQWSERRAAGDALQSLKTERDRILEFRDDLSRLRDRTDEAGASADDLKELDALESKMPASVRPHHKALGVAQDSPREADLSAPKDATFDTDARPSGPFMAAASHASRISQPAESVDPRLSSVSTPAPR